MELYGVAIIGAGIAGLTAAKEIESFYKTIIFDKEKNPYQKIACAEWTSFFLPVQPVQLIDGMVMEYNDIIVEKKWRGKIIDREKLQKQLLENLKKADIHLGEKVERIEKNTIITEKGKYRAEYIIGADGPLSVTRKSYKLPISPVLPAVNSRVRIKKPLRKAYIYFAKEINKGYGWCFPKEEYANIGVGAATNLKVSFEFLIHFLYKRRIINKKVYSYSIGVIPLYGFSPFINERIFLIGDAAGLIDPLTGAGIYQAWDSAILVTKVLKNEINYKQYREILVKTYRKFLRRRQQKRKIFEKEWHKDLKKAVEKAWISIYQE